MQSQLKVFKNMHTKNAVILDEYLREHLSVTKPPKLYVGTDSQYMAGKTIYVSTVVLRYEGNGAKVIFTKEVLKQNIDMWTRLWDELERSLVIANYIAKDLGYPIEQIDMDYNQDENSKSNKVFKAAKGYIDSLGFKSGAKPQLLIATWAANVLCH